ncbi:MAG: hypothetical protein HZC41_11485 [Chloroflexi bacterium]|nr:hypothetical protein [Chloroflexota bacterium]
MDESASILLVGAVLLLVIGGVWLRLYFRYVDPWLRRVLGRALGVTIRMGEENIWQINDEPVDSLKPHNLLVRPLQIVSLLFAAILPLVVTMAILIGMSGK